MSIYIRGVTSGLDADVDPTFQALHSTLRPPEATAWNSIGATSGLITTIAANGLVFAFRNLGATIVMVRRVSVGFLTTTAFTAAQALAYRMYVSRAFTVDYSAGTQIVLTGNEAKHRTSLATPTNINARISAAAVVTAGTRTIDTASIGIVGGGVGALGTAIPVQEIFSQGPGDYPLILGENEGFEIQNAILMGATGVGNLLVNVEFAEVPAY